MFLIGIDLGYYWSRHNYLKPIYIHEYNVSIIAPTGEGFRAFMIYDALHYHQSNRPINAHRELLRTLSFDRGKIKYLGWVRERYICVIERRCVWQTLFLNQEPRNQFTRKFENWVPSNRPRLLPGRTRKKDEGLWNNCTHVPNWPYDCQARRSMSLLKTLALKSMIWNVYNLLFIWHVIMFFMI